MDFVNDDRERPVSPATGFADAMNAQSHNTDASKSEFKTESPARLAALKKLKVPPAWKSIWLTLYLLSTENGENELQPGL